MPQWLILLIILLLRIQPCFCATVPQAALLSLYEQLDIIADIAPFSPMPGTCANKHCKNNKRCEIDCYCKNAIFICETESGNSKLCQLCQAGREDVRQYFSKGSSKFDADWEKFEKGSVLPWANDFEGWPEFDSFSSSGNSDIQLKEFNGILAKYGFKDRLHAIYTKQNLTDLFKAGSRKVHPDKGGSSGDFAKFDAAYKALLEKAFE